MPFAAELQNIQAQGRFRSLREINSPQGPTVRVGNRALLNFCSNDYLGMANDKRLIKAMRQAAEEYGAGSGASPLICGRSIAHHDLEQQVARFTGRDRALVFATGYMANLAVATALGPGRAGTVFADRLNHASLYDGAVLSRARLVRYRHSDASALASALAGRKRPWNLVLTDAVFSMDGDIAPLPEIAASCKQHQALLAVDDAHGFGVLGKNGRGTLSLCDLGQEEAPILIVTFGKALGVAGACVTGKAEAIEMLVQKARPYIYSTAMPAALAATASASLKIVQDEESRRERLRHLINFFRSGARQRGLPVRDSTTPIQPLIIGNDMEAVRVSEELLHRDVLVAAIRPPTVPVNSSRLRITLTAAHTEAQVLRLLESLTEVLGGNLVQR